MDKETYILTQISAERLAYKTLIMAGKKLKSPSVKDMVTRYSKLYDDIMSELTKEK